MNEAILFENVSKRYQLGGAHSSLREALVGIAGGLGKRRRGPRKEPFWALRQVSFSIPRGHALGLVGPNGAGKTTALKILANIVEPSAGRVEVRGRTSALIELGAGFHPDLTGRENVYLNAAILGLTRRETTAIFDRIVDFSGLEPFIDTPVKRYSSGMYVRLGFSVAAHIHPDVLLVDEVLAVGDAQFRQKCARRIEELRESGATIVLVAHNLFLVKSICDLGIFLADGRIQAEGDILSAITGYESWMHQKKVENADAGTSPDRANRNGSELDITAVEVCRPGSEAELSGAGFQWDECVVVRVHYQAMRPVPEANLVLRIVRADGVTASMIRTVDYGRPLGGLTGSGVVSVELDPIQLAGGAYTVDARLTGAVDGVPLAQGHSSWFQVAGLSVSHTEGSGVYVPRVSQVTVAQKKVEEKWPTT